MIAFNSYIAEQLEIDNPSEDFCVGTDRYAMYKAGPVLSVSVSMSNVPSKLHNVLSKNSTL